MKMEKDPEAMWYVKEETTKNLGGIFFKRQRLQKEGLEQTTEKISAQHKGFLTSVQSQMEWLVCKHA